MPDYYLKSCRDCIDFARSAHDAEARAAYLALAQKWVRIYIDGLAATDARQGDAPSDGSRPVS
jgi:hypothetical protein